MARVEEKTVIEARRKLASSLPVGHPAQKEVDDLLATMWAELGEADLALNAAHIDTEKAETTIATHVTLVDVLEDYRRGIRDWSEVEDALKAAGFARAKQEDRA